MKRYWAVAVFFASLPATTQDHLAAQPEALVRSLYTQVVARHPLGIPRDENWKVFAPYLSRTLLHRIGLARSSVGGSGAATRGEMRHLKKHLHITH